MPNIGGCPLYQELGTKKYCEADADWNKFYCFKKSKDIDTESDRRLLCYGQFSECQNFYKAAKFLKHRT